MKTVVQLLEQMIPKSLNDIIRTNRNQVKAYFSTDAEIQALRGRRGLAAAAGLKGRAATMANNATDFRRQ